MAETGRDHKIERVGLDLVLHRSSMKELLGYSVHWRANTGKSFRAIALVSRSTYHCGLGQFQGSMIVPQILFLRLRLLLNLTNATKADAANAIDPA